MSSRKWAYSEACEGKTCIDDCDKCMLDFEYTSFTDDGISAEDIDSIVLENHIDQYTGEIQDMVSKTLHNRDKETNDRVRFASLMVANILIDSINGLNKILDGLVDPESPNIIDQHMNDIRSGNYERSEYK